MSWRSSRPLAKIPVLVDETAGLMLPESTTIIEVPLLVGAEWMVAPSPRTALQARLWDRFHDQYVSTPMQKIVGDALRPEGRTGPRPASRRRGATLDIAYGILDGQLATNAWSGGRHVHARRLRRRARARSTRASCTAGDDERPHLDALLPRPDANGRRSRASIDEARPYRELFPLPWPADVDAY